MSLVDVRRRLYVSAHQVVPAFQCASVLTDLRRLARLRTAQVVTLTAVAMINADGNWVSSLSHTAVPGLLLVHAIGCPRSMTVHARSVPQPA
jgi:hypothetical protein